MAEYDRLCVCGHERRKHTHGHNDEKQIVLHGGLCTAPGCRCSRFDDAGGQAVTHVMCQNCGTRPATVTWVGDGGLLAYGGGVPWCQHCSTEARLEYARKLAAQIPELEKELESLP